MGWLRRKELGIRHSLAERQRVNQGGQTGSGNTRQHPAETHLRTISTDKLRELPVVKRQRRNVKRAHIIILPWADTVNPGFPIFRLIWGLEYQNHGFVFWVADAQAFPLPRPGAPPLAAAPLEAPPVPPLVVPLAVPLVEPLAVSAVDPRMDGGFTPGPEGRYPPGGGANAPPDADPRELLA